MLYDLALITIRIKQLSKAIKYSIVSSQVTVGNDIRSQQKMDLVYNL